MDSSGEELGRIVAFVNRRPWIMEENPQDHYSSSSSSSSSCSDNDKSVASNNYFLDRLGISDSGDSSLHRICAWHAAPEQFQAFLDHMEAHQRQEQQLTTTSNQAVSEPCNEITNMVIDPISTTGSLTGLSDNNHAEISYLGMPPPPRLDQTNDKGVSALHIAVYRNSFHVYSMVQMLLKQQPSLASQQMTCGSTPLHILCAHNVTIRKDVLMAVLEADPSAVWKEDCHGDTPLSLLWKNVLRFRWAQSDHIVLEHDDEEEDATDDAGYSANAIRRRRHRPRPSWMTVISPDKYVEYSLLMVRAALGKTNGQEHPLSLVDICRMPRCPPLLVRLVLQHYTKLAESCQLVTPLTMEATDQDGMTPLHHAARAKSVTQQFVPSHVQTKTQSVVDCLLDSFPCMIFAQDRGGRLPLHYALDKTFGHGDNNNNNTSNMQEMESYYKSLYRFVKTNPDSLRMKDPMTGLYPFALLAASSCGTASGTNESDENTMDIDYESPPEEDLVHLGAIYRFLRRFPEAAIYRG